MCVTFFVLKPSTGKNQNIQFVIAFNRDEQVQRKTLKFAPFEQDSNIYAGKDLVSKGTWLGLNIKTGIFVFLTNFDLEQPRMGKSRGQMMKKFLNSEFISQKTNKNQVEDKIRQEMNTILSNPQSYSAFNLVVYHIQTSTIFYICTQNGMKEPQILQQNIKYGLCNGELEDIWPKTQHGIEKFSEIINQMEKNNQKTVIKQLQILMKDRKSFNEDPEREASIFIDRYYSKEQQAERITKSTFLAVIKNQGGKINAQIKQITHDSKLGQEIVQLSLKF